MSEQERKSPGPLPERELSTEEAMEIESDRWRRVVAAFLLGSEARPERGVLRPWSGLLGGLGLAVAIAVLVGVIGVAGATLAANDNVPKSTPTPAVTIPSLPPAPAADPSSVPAAGSPRPAASVPAKP
jgi:hypothetical protein